MANPNECKPCIFLSASIPLETRDKVFFDTMDVLAIRDAVRALATIAIPSLHLVWGGHPSITPLIRNVIKTQGFNSKECVTLYQSRLYEKLFPKDNGDFEDVVLIDASIGDTLENYKQSLQEMRKAMFDKKNFVAGVFIGGMEGIGDEYKMFREAYPQALVFPIASTGAASKIVFEQNRAGIDNKYHEDLQNNYAYMSLFRKLLKKYLPCIK